jgi:hypothetical protein
MTMKQDNLESLLKEIGCRTPATEIGFDNLKLTSKKGF